MGLTNILLCRKCGAEDENSTHILCECGVLASLRHVHLVSFLLDPEDTKSLILGPSGTLAKEQSSPKLVSDYEALRAHLLWSRCIGTLRARTQMLISQSTRSSLSF